PCTLFCYTDGVIEAMDVEDRQFTHERMIETLHRVGGEGPDRVIEQMRRAISEFTGEAPQSDDITMLAVRVG
ncbi:MAG: PP2C family protein-serine/threonine phosphatase, partial [Phycisphaerae bacterium]